MKFPLFLSKITCNKFCGMPDSRKNFRKGNKYIEKLKKEQGKCIYETKEKEENFWIMKKFIII